MQVKDYQKLQEIILLQNLELCGLAINIASFSHFLNGMNFYPIVAPFSPYPHYQK